MSKKKALVFIVAYNAETSITQVLSRIPEEIWNGAAYDTEVLVVDDASSDATALKCNQFMLETGKFLRILRNPKNQGYGGNQKIGYSYAIRNDFDMVALLHGDAQYPPEKLPELFDKINSGADAALGSRMVRKRDALKGGMPFYKFAGNIILTRLQNLVLGTHLSEFHTGFRAYKVAALKSIPFHCNADGFDFDTDILIQLSDSGYKIEEIPIPTRYGDEVCHVNGIKYALAIILSTFRSRVQKYHIFYDPKFDYNRNVYNPVKTNFDSSHSYAIAKVRPGSRVICIGEDLTTVAYELTAKGCRVFGYGSAIPEDASYFENFAVLDVDKWTADPQDLPPADYIILLDMLSNTSTPEKFLRQIRDMVVRDSPEVIITIGNIGFLPVRLMLLLGQFNYGRRGILAHFHKRLFTLSSICRMLKYQGFNVLEIKGIPVPIPFVIKNRKLSMALLGLNNLLIKISPGMFSFQLAIHASIRPTLDMLLENAAEGGRSEFIKAMSMKSDS